MDQSKEQILQMLSNGDITAEEADRLLAAITPDVVEPPEAEPVSLNGLPDVESLREKWKPVLGVALLVLAWSGSAIFGQRKRGLFGKLLLPFHILMLVVSAIGALLAYWSRESRWLYLDIEKTDGSRFMLSGLPLPVHVLIWLLKKISPYMDTAEDREQVKTALEFLQAVQDEMDQPGGDPIAIDIKDSGQRVQIYVL